jgi:hypothetical protein
MIAAAALGAPIAASSSPRLGSVAFRNAASPSAASDDDTVQQLITPEANI